MSVKINVDPARLEASASHIEQMLSLIHICHEVFYKIT